MSGAQIEIQVIAILVAIACAIPGTFLVLRKMAMISDAISHAILPGIVVGFFLSGDLASPVLIATATLCGLLTVALVELITNTRLVKEDAAIGLVFPALFSIGILMITRYASDVHLDTDAVLLGELAFAPFDRLRLGGIDLGPKSLWVMAVITCMSFALLFAFFKELKIATFDRELAASLGFSPIAIHYGLMAATSITSVGAFDAVGAVLVIAFMIAPAATAYLLTNRLSHMIALSCGIGSVCAVAGYWLARGIDASIAGSMSTMLGLCFVATFLLSPHHGVVSAITRRRRRKLEFSLLTFLLHLRNHSTAEAERERYLNHLSGHFNWAPKLADDILRLATDNNMVSVDGPVANLTEKGRSFTDEALDYILTNKNRELESMKDRFLLFRG